MKKLSIILLMAILFSSCETGDNKRVFKASNGRINHLMVVMKNSEWQGELGDELRKIIAEPVLGLPQPEAQFEVSQVPPDSLPSAAHIRARGLPQAGRRADRHDRRAG